MTPIESFRGKSVALFGLGGSGLATARALVAGGADVAAWDDDESARARGDRGRRERRRSCRRRLAPFRRARAVARRAADPSRAALDGRSARRPPASRSSATSSSSAASVRARAPAPPFVAITGTNGKSTTTRADRAYSARGRPATSQLGGNIGAPDPRACAAGRRTHSRPGVLVLPDRPRAVARADHRHSAQSHARSSRPPRDDGALRGDQGARSSPPPKSRWSASTTHYCRAIGAQLIASGAAGPARRAGLRRSAPLDWGFYADGSGSCYRAAGDPAVQTESLGDLAGVARAARRAQCAERRLRRRRLLGARPRPTTTSRRGLRAFPASPHRMEEVARMGRVLFVNDSKATNADAAAQALAGFDGHLLDRRRQGRRTAASSRCVRCFRASPRPI